jgi:NAD(P)-dependent dehydrogenase (short-subunit alcohol dehydrogenase family)
MPTGHRPETPLRRGDPGDWFYTQEWRRSVAPLDAPGLRRDRPILVLGSDSPLSARLVEALRAEGRPVLLALAGDTCMRGGPDWFVVRPGETNDIEAMVEALRAEHRIPADVVHLWTLAPVGPQAGALARFERVRDRAFRSLVGLARALGRRGFEAKACIHVVSNGAQEVAGEGSFAPLSALLLGTCRVAASELPGLRFRNIDLHHPELDAGVGPDLVRRLLAELVSEAPDDLVALRGRERLVAHVAALRLAARHAGPSWLRERGVYLITGGLGAIGLTLAEHLARKVRARLVLLGRRGLPARDAWAAWFAQHGEFDPTSRKIRRVQAAEDLGAEVMTLAGDVTDPLSVRAAVDAARTRFGKIHGVFHFASVHEEGPLRSRTLASADRVLAPRVLGALNLGEALADADPDFLLFTSTLAAAGGLRGRIDAAAADSCLGSLAAARSAAGRPTFCLGWGEWRAIGMAADRERAFALAAATHPGSPLDHPLLQRQLGVVYGEEVLLGAVSPENEWVLAEHRLVDGTPLLPAAAHLELTLLAHRAVGGTMPIEIRDLAVLRPLGVRGEGPCALRVRLDPSGGELQIEARTAARPDARWEPAASGRIAPSAGEAPIRPLAEIRARCGARRLRLEGHLPQAHLALGPRFACLRAVGFGDGEILAEVELDATFAADLDRYALHPALIEMATSCAHLLIPDWNPVRDFYLPTGYARVRIWRPAPARFLCHVRHRRAGPDEREVTFDVTLLDPDAREIVAIDGLAFARVDELQTLRGEARAEAIPGAYLDERLPDGYLEQSIHVDEGLAAIDRVLCHEPPAHLLVAPHPLAGWIEAVALDATTDAPDEASEVDRQLWELAAGGAESELSEAPPDGEPGLG